MPLEKGRSKRVVQRNTAELIASGRKPDQAYAIANRVAGTAKPGKGKSSKKK